MAYEIICSTFLLKLISESDDDNDDSDETTNASVMSIVEKLSKKMSRLNGKMSSVAYMLMEERRNSSCFSPVPLVQAKARQSKLQNNSACNSASTQKYLG